MFRPIAAALREAGTSFVARPIRLVLGAIDEALTIGCAAAFALLVLAQPAFQETGPGWLKRLQLAATFLDRHGREIGRRGILHDDAFRLDELPPHLVAAVLATEDRRFRQHWGIDPVGLGRALLANAEADSVVQGGSTITQQLAKNLFLTAERTLDRKIREAFLAVWLECQLSKDEILKLYLDRAYMGSGTFGVEAASRLYFGKSARDVTLPEAAMLAGLFKAPSRYAPNRAPDAAEARAAEVLDRMFDAGWITAAEHDRAIRVPAAPVAAEPQQRHPDHYLDWAFRELQGLAAAGRLGAATVLTVETAFDPEMQGAAEARIAAALGRDGTRLHVGDAAAVVMEPGGAVRSMVGGRDYGASQFNRAVDARRQPGSAFKPFVYAAALAHGGFRPGSIVPDAEICIGRWCPRNYSRSFSGPVTLTTALAHSLNTVAVRLSVEIGRVAGEISVARQARFGRARIMDLGQALGLRVPLQDTPSLPLGASEVSLLDLTASYAVFASGGYKADPFAAVTVRNARGDILYRRDRDVGPSRRVLAEDLAGEMNAMLAAVVETGTARGAAFPGHRVAGKTGTTSAYRDAWFVGFTSHLVGGIWLGNDDDMPTRGVTGGTLPVSIWRSVMADAHRDLPPLPLPRGETTLLARAGTGAFQEVGRPASGSSGRGFAPAPSAAASFQVLGR